MLRHITAGSTAACVLSLIACSGATQNGALPMSAAARSSAPRTTGTSNITEYPVPTGVAPRYITVAADGDVWFGNGADIGTATSREVFGRLHAGTIQMLQLPAATQNVMMGFATLWRNRVWGIAVDNSIDEGQDYLVRANGSMTPAVFPSTDDNQYWAMAAGPDGRLWYASCLEACGMFPTGGGLGSRNPGGSGGPSVAFKNYDAAFGLTAGPDANLYAAVRYGGPPGPHDSYVFKIATSGTVLQKIALPQGSRPEGIALGPDGNLWVTEPGTNRIARVTTAGVVTQFSLPAANAQPQQITAASDGALWFAEMSANAIGRITTTGSITQYTVPTAASQPFGIASVRTCPNGHAVLWFTEYAAGKIGKLSV